MSKSCWNCKNFACHSPEPEWLETWCKLTNEKNPKPCENWIHEKVKKGTPAEDIPDEALICAFKMCSDSSCNDCPLEGSCQNIASLSIEIAKRYEKLIEERDKR